MTETRVPRLRPGPGACDTHMHIFASGAPLAATAKKSLPQAATLADYRRLRKRLGLERAILVQPTHYGLDNSVQLEAMRAMGESACVIAVLNSTVSDDELSRLDMIGCRGVRFFLFEGGALRLDELEAIAARIAPLGWHIELQMNGMDFPALAERVAALPCQVTIAHIGRFLKPVGHAHPAFRAMAGLLDTGRYWMKISAPYVHSRSGPPDYADIAAHARFFVSRFPERCLWASNWPHTNDAIPPDEADLLDLLLDWCEGEERLYRQILCSNPSLLYRFREKR